MLGTPLEMTFGTTFGLKSCATFVSCVVLFARAFFEGFWGSLGTPLDILGRPLGCLRAPFGHPCGPLEVQHETMEDQTCIRATEEESSSTNTIFR